MTCPVVVMPGETLEHAKAMAERAQFEVECFDELPQAIRHALSNKANQYGPSFATRLLEEGVSEAEILAKLAELPDGPSIRPNAHRARHPRRAGNTYR